LHETGQETNKDQKARFRQVVCKREELNNDPRGKSVSRKNDIKKEVGGYLLPLIFKTFLPWKIRMQSSVIIAKKEKKAINPWRWLECNKTD
jgi:hypothetical protein